MKLVITKGPGLGNYRRITGFVGGVMTVGTAFTETPTTASLFKVDC